MANQPAPGYLPGDPRFGLQGEALKDYYRNKPAQWAIYCWDKDGEASRLLHDQYLAFGERHNATWYVYEASSRAHVRLLERSRW